MKTQISNWKLAYWFLLTAAVLLVFGYGLFAGFRRGFSDGVTFKSNPLQFCFYVLVMAIGATVGLILLFIGVMAMLQRA